MQLCTWDEFELIKLFSAKGLVATFGAENIWEYRFLDTDFNGSKAVIYISWYGWWDLKK